MCSSPSLRPSKINKTNLQWRIHFDATTFDITLLLRCYPIKPINDKVIGKIKMVSLVLSKVICDSLSNFYSHENEIIKTNEQQSIHLEVQKFHSWVEREDIWFH